MGLGWDWVEGRGSSIEKDQPMTKTNLFSPPSVSPALSCSILLLPLTSTSYAFLVSARESHSAKQGERGLGAAEAEVEAKEEQGRSTQSYIVMGMPPSRRSLG